MKKMWFLKMRNNNWTKRLGYDSEEGEEPENIFIREYEYY